MRALIAFVTVAMGVLTASAWAADGKPTNAAQVKYGAKVSFAAKPPAVGDKRTSPDEVCDGNVHSRYVVTGAPYSLVIDLVDKLPIEKVSLSLDDYDKEVAPKEIEVSIDDDQPVKFTMELKRPAKRQPAWQDVPIGKAGRRVTVKVLSNHEPEGSVKWGGMGEIAVWTSEDLESRFALPDYDAKSRIFVNGGVPLQKEAPKVTLPPVAKPGEHPSLLMTKQEVAELKKTLKDTPKGQAALKTLIGIADNALEAKIDFPDPKGPLGQMKDRGDAVAQAHDRLSFMAGNLGRAYSLTDDVRYAKKAAELLVGYADRYPQYPEHKGVNGSDTGKVMAQRLSEAMWLIPLIQATDHIYDSGALTDAQKQKIEKDLIRAGVEFIRRQPAAKEVAARDAKFKDWRTAPPPTQAGKGAPNWINFYAATTIMAGSLYEDQNLIDLAVGDYRMLIHEGIGEDGMWGEGAIGYQMFALSAMLLGLETAARQGVDLWSAEDGRVKRLFDSTLWYAYPDASAPGINDSGRAALGGWQTENYDYGYLRYGDQRYAPVVNKSTRQLQFSQGIYFPSWIYTELREPAAVAYPSLIFKSLGYAILRDGDRYTLLKSGPHGGVHGHLDKLNLILFAGDELGGEPTMHRYEDALHHQWTVQTVAHNTMTVDERQQIPSNGRITVFEGGPIFKIARGDSAEAVPGAIIDRTVVMTPEGVIDLYAGRSKLKRTWDRTMRFNGALKQIEGATPGEVIGTGSGYDQIKLVKRLPAPETWVGQWQTKPKAMTAAVAGVAGQEVILGVGPDQDQIALARQTGERASFAMYYRTGDEAASIKLLETGSPNLAAAEAPSAGGKTIVLVSHKAGAWKALGWESDARVLCVREDGEKRIVTLAGGTFAKGTAGEIKLDKAGNASAEGPAGKLNIVRLWSPDATAPEAVQTPPKK